LVVQGLPRGVTNRRSPCRPCVAANARARLAGTWITSAFSVFSCARCSVPAAAYWSGRNADAAKAAEEAGYDCLVCDPFSMEWVGLGGVLDWQAEECELWVRCSR